jgi:hypothetical protein
VSLLLGGANIQVTDANIQVVGAKFPFINVFLYGSKHKHEFYATKLVSARLQNANNQSARIA